MRKHTGRRGASGGRGRAGGRGGEVEESKAGALTRLVARATVDLLAASLRAILGRLRGWLLRKGLEVKMPCGRGGRYKHVTSWDELNKAK